MTDREKELLIGAHTSASGGAYKALLHGKEIGATAIQLFTANQKTWNSKPIDDKAVELWEETKKNSGILMTMSHDSYLINLGSPNPETLQKSRTLFREELLRCQMLKIDYLNFHPGAATTGTVEECLNTIVESLLEIAPLANKGPTRLLIETTAGQGTTVGWSFDEIGFLIKSTQAKLPIGVCMDTCHSFCAGYDIRTKDGWEKTLAEFEKKIGLKHLYALHLNDSMKPFESRRDRHAPLGEGEIGIECFKQIMTNPKLRNLILILETPQPEKWPEEIQLLRKFAQEKHRAKM